MSTDSGSRRVAWRGWALAVMLAGAMGLLVESAHGQEPVATGGTVTNYSIGGINYLAHLFTNLGGTNITFTRGGEIEVLIVAGGGGGGHNGGGGGGAGGVVYADSVTVTNGQSVSITVGDGGTGSTSISVRGGDGENSVFGDLIAYGGGGGASRDGGGLAGAGGSGGGGGGGDVGRTTPGPIIVEGQGHVGGAGFSSGGNSSGGGGGGAGAPGTAGVSQQGGDGGDGRAFDLSGPLTWYAGGGGGGKTSAGGAGDGGDGGGGDGAYGSRNHGADNTGGGGGGGSGGTPSGFGGNGGSGIVIVRYIGFGIENRDATNVTLNGATLNGWLRSTSGETDVSVSVLWGPENGAGEGVWANTNTWLAGHWAEGSYPELAVTGLSSDTTYFYTYAASNATASAWADPPMTFITGNITVEATEPVAELGGNPGRFTIRRPGTATNAALTVHYTMSGDAGNGIDYGLLPGNVTLAAGESEATVDVIPTVAPRESSKDAVLTLWPGNYALGASGTAATVTIPPYTGLGYVCVVPTGMSTPATPYDTWATAAQDIHAAVAFTVTNQIGFAEVVISNGTYNITSQLDVTNAVTVRGFEGGLAGATNTIVQRSSGTTRIVRLAHPDAIVEGLTIRNGSGQSGAGVHMTGGMLRDCMVRDNAAAGTLGGGVYIGGGGVVSNCVIQGNSTGILGGGGGAYVADGLLFGSTIVSNTAFSGGNHGGGGVMADGEHAWVKNCMILYNRETRDGNGAGVRLSGGARLRNSLVRGNSIPSTDYIALGGGIYMTGAASTVENCTVVENTVTVHSGGGIYQAGGSVVNSIVYLNTAPSGANHDGGVNFSYTCTTPIDGLSGPGNTSLNPQFISVSGGNFRIESGPARGTGDVMPWMSDATDLDGEARLDADGKVDMGAYQYHPGALVASLVAVGPSFGPAPFSATFQAFVDGANTNGLVYRWDFQDDGMFDLEGGAYAAPTHVYADPGIYSVRLSVTNAVGEEAVFTNAALITVTGTNLYVNLTGSNQPPYLTPATAANSFLDAFNIAGGGAHIQVGTGTYTVAESVHIDRAVRVSSLSGPQSTVVERTGAGHFRVFHLAHADAVVEGLTIRNGGSVSGSGATVAAGILRDCVLRNNGGTSALNIAGGTVSNSVIRHNTLSIPQAVIEISSGLLYGSSIVSNTVTGGGNSGGGILASGADALISHCTIAHNGMTRDGHGAGVRLANGARLRNSLIVSNTISSVSFPPMHGGGVYMAGAASVIENGTIVGNSVATDEGGGVYMADGTVRSSIVIHNTAPTYPATDNYRLAGSGMTYSLSTPKPPGDDNIDDQPLFVDPAGGDFRLQVKPIVSPAIDAGHPGPYTGDLAWIAVTNAVDLDGSPRLQNDRVDMGAYEMFVPPGGSLFLLR